jgi:hypothetical protein
MWLLLQTLQQKINTLKRQVIIKTSVPILPPKTTIIQGKLIQ